MKLNKQNLLSFRTYLAGLNPDRFRMDTWISPCGTAACIAGHVWQHFTNGREFVRSPFENPRDRLTEFACKKFGLSTKHARILFEPNGISERHERFEGINLKAALHVLDRIIETDDVRLEFWQEGIAKTALRENDAHANEPFPLAA